jgi:hypothetical protein
MSRRRPPKNDVERERRARRAADVRRCRARLRAGRVIYPFEADAQTFDLAERYAGLDPGRISDRQATISALSRLLRMAIAALVRERLGRRWKRKCNPVTSVDPTGFIIAGWSNPVA